MRFWHLAILTLAACLTGCLSSGGNRALEEENFRLSEQVLRMEVQMNQVCSRLKQCQAQLAAAEQTMLDGDVPSDDQQDSPSSNLTPPKVDIGPINGGDPGPPPEFEPAPKFEPDTSFPDASDDPLPSPPNVTRLQPVSANLSRDEHITHILLGGRLTDGFDADPEQPGDEGIVVVVEPRNEAEELVRVAGEIVIEAWDSRLLEEYAHDPRQEEKALVGVWLFNAKDAATWFDDDDKLHFELLWPATGRPDCKELDIFVECKTPQGHLLEAETQIHIQHTGRRPQPVRQAKPNETPRRKPRVGKRPVWRPYR